MKKSLTILFLFALLIISCKNEKSIDTSLSKTEEISSENIKNAILNLDTPEIKDTSKANPNIIENNKIKVETIQETEKVKVAKLELEKKKAEVLVKKIEASSYKKMNCEKMILKYKSIIEEYKKTKNDELLLWKDTNDPIFKFCYEKHTVVFDSLERIENELGNDMEY